MMETIRFKNDTLTLRRLFVPDAFQHPAKGQLGMWATMIERYSQPGETVLDPMAGSGATLLAALMGRNVICVELEQHFVDPMRRSWEKMRTMPMLGFSMGSVVILRGDARCLPLVSADVVITSPPWEDKTALQDSKWLHDHEAELAQNYRERNPGKPGNPGNTKPENRSTMEGYTMETCYCICHGTSQHIRVCRHCGRECTSGLEHDYGSCAEGCQDGYTHKPVNEYLARPMNAIESLAAAGDKATYYIDGSQNTNPFTRPVDAIVTSPSYEGTNIGRSESLGEAPFGGPNSQARGAAYSPGNAENIGNQRGDAYWESMRQVYSECWRVLRPGGIMALVLKGFTRDGRYIDLPGQTEALLLEAGWQKHDAWKRELWSLSFWRILQKRRDPAAFDDRLNYEEVLAFRKPDGQGQGVDTVITSPPYEGGGHHEGAFDTWGGVQEAVGWKGGYTRPPR